MERTSFELTALQMDCVGNYVVHLASVGNPDYGQHPGCSMPGVPKRRLAVKTMREAAQACRDYIDQHDLGGGNWSGGDVYDGDTLVARVSYNGRIWKP